MSTAFLSQDIWPEITNTVRASGKRCFVAVAYFGAAASRRLPLLKGSLLVVDASERAVACGQTCPADLASLLNRGVRVYSVPNLHAKVFVVGRTAYVGSTNVSDHSASQLVEAVVRTTEPSVVSTARQFVVDHCLHELTPEVLRQLAEIYRPPQIPGGGGKGRTKDKSSRPTLPRVLLAQLELEDWSEREQQVHDKGLVVAKKLRKHYRNGQIDDFRLTGKCRYVVGDVVIQFTDEGNGRVMVSPPGNVIHVLPPQPDGNSTVSFVYLERPERNRRQLKAFARSARCLQAELLRDRVIREPALKGALLKAWASR